MLPQCSVNPDSECCRLSIIDSVIRGSSDYTGPAGSLIWELSQSAATLDLTIYYWPSWSFFISQNLKALYSTSESSSRLLSFMLRTSRSTWTCSLKLEALRSITIDLFPITGLLPPPTALPLTAAHALSLLSTSHISKKTPYVEATAVQESGRCPF